jgi:CRP-like cAMP-binding protein
MIFEEGDESNAAYIITEGEFLLYKKFDFEEKDPEDSVLNFSKSNKLMLKNSL